MITRKDSCKRNSGMPAAMAQSCRGPSLYEFLLEAELSHYYSAIKNDLKVASVNQLKYVEEDDLAQLGMSKPEQRRLRKYFHKYFPQTYLKKIKQMILPKVKDDSDSSSVLLLDATIEKNQVKVPSKHIIPADGIVINKELGVGEFGVVQQGVWTNEEGDRIQVAIKCLSKDQMQNNPMEFLKEAAIMHTIDHEHIVRLYGVVLDTNALMLVTELAPLRSLLECLKEPALRPSFPVISLCDFALQICDGMQYLESMRLIHRDLAARNILVFAKNKVKISDFGLSRALGVGKDYYQTNFNVNLKLPIAWCAPECINFLRFTSASDVWAYGVTLWEMFSYGFQPWAALTGQQILEAIDEPNFQRLEQPECCPKEYFTLMLKCWQHDPNKRPKFSEIQQLLPDCKPEQVQAVNDYSEVISGTLKGKKDALFYKTGDVITVLDKRPLADNPTLWKGVTNSGKTGLFNPANTIAYLGHNLPTNRPSFSRSDSKTGIYSSRRRLRPDMISRPQGDFKHTGHVGLDGAFFGDVAFLGDKYSQLPKQVVTPYKPHEDKELDSSDVTPLLISSGSMVDGKSGPASESWSDTGSEKDHLVKELILDKKDKSGRKKNKSTGNSPKSGQKADHEYHEISDEELFESMESPKFESFDLGPSLIDEVFKALGTSKMEFDFEESHNNETSNVKNELKEMASKVIGMEGLTTSKKKQAMVKPISAADSHTLDSAIAMAKELASKSMQDLDYRSESDAAQDSPRTPNSPTKRKFSFKFKTSPKLEKKSFSEEAESISDIQDSLTDEAKEAYNSLVEKGLEKTPTSPDSVFHSSTSSLRSSVNHPIPPVNPPHTTDSSDAEADTVESNPLRMLRSGMPVRPKVRGNKHGIPNSCRATTPHTATVARLAANASAMSISNPIPVTSRTGLGAPPPPPPTKPSLERRSPEESHFRHEEQLNGNENGNNPLPLPPRDRSRPSLTPLKQHQRRHPLLLQNLNPRTEASHITGRQDSGDSLVSPVESVSSSQYLRSASESSESSAIGATNVTNSTDTHQSSLKVNGQEGTKIPPPKPARTSSLDDSFENQIQAEIDGLDYIPEDAHSPPIYKNSDHVSCEDLLEFAMDKPNAKRTQGRARGADSDEVRIMQKVLAKQQVSPEECLVALNETEWDIHKAIKYVRLQCLLSSHYVSTENFKQTLIRCNWDVQQARNYLLATQSSSDDTTEV